MDLKTKYGIGDEVFFVGGWAESVKCPVCGGSGELSGLDGVLYDCPKTRMGCEWGAVRGEWKKCVYAGDVVYISVHVIKDKGVSCSYTLECKGLFDDKGFFKDMKRLENDKCSWQGSYNQDEDDVFWSVDAAMEQLKSRGR